MSINIKVKPDTEVRKAKFVTRGKKVDADDYKIKQELEFEKKNKEKSSNFDISFLGLFPLFSLSSKEKRLMTDEKQFEKHIDNTNQITEVTTKNHYTDNHS
ncbi:24807_t:CDS:2 [Cetraspora pellucida]|uniref:24807_t:CDS:1 n=1 Tax=Cetraspora pellucida TaxID=1433469 RepID=A0A9N9AQ90_9GLOM|nr:24807_t:CDS:2 [Cetraspora pellucida]